MEERPNQPTIGVKKTIDSIDKESMHIVGSVGIMKSCTSSKVPLSKGNMIEVTIGSQTTPEWTLVDTGSAVNLIDYTFLNELPGVVLDDGIYPASIEKLRVAN